MKKQILAATLMVVAGMMAGCGGGGGSTISTTSTPAASGVAAVSGKVADGYLVNATVFMDKNGNYRLDAGEPSTTTDANGAYTLNVDPADVGKYPIIAMAVKGVTMDVDTNQAVTSSYLMSMPKQSVSGTVSSNFISPFSTQLREMMETGNYATMQQAMDALRTKMHLPNGTNMLADYVAGQNTTMHNAAQNMATLMGGQMSAVFGNSTSATAVDVNRYRGMMGAIFSNMSSIKNATAQGNMTTLMTNMMNNLAGIQSGQPFRNMSTSFRMGGSISGGMMGGSLGGSMGSSVGSSTGIGSTGSMMGKL